MRHIVSALFVATPLFMSTSSLAGPHFLANCATEDGNYTVYVAYAPPAVPGKEPVVRAAIKDAQGTYVAAYYAEVVHGESNNYGGVKYVDKASHGNQFALEAPAKGARGFKVNATLSLAGKIRISDENMQCSAFNRQLPGR
jgi:hypothetical protein